MTEYSERESIRIQEEVRERCFEARCAADHWASQFDEMKPESEIIEEAHSRYRSFYERDAFIREAEEVFMLIAYRKNKNHDK